MVDLIELTYSLPFEEEVPDPALSWEKKTIQYVLQNKAWAHRVIRYHIWKITNNIRMDTEEVYSDVLLYLSKAKDYEDGMISPYNGEIVSLESYVSALIRCCAKRYITETHKREKYIIKQQTIEDNEGHEKNIIETVSDKKSLECFEEAGFNLSNHIKHMEHLRYKYKHDIFMFLYVSLLTIDNNKINNSDYLDILDVLGISKRELKQLEEACRKDENVRQLLRALSKYSNKEAVEILEKYVYGSNMIKKGIEKLCSQEKFIQCAKI